MDSVMDAETECLMEALADNATTETAQLLCGNATGQDPLVVGFEPALWQADFPVAVAYVAILSVALALGTFGNIIILIVSLTTSTMNKIGRDFVVNLAIADLCVNMIAEPMCILGVVKGEKWFSGRWLFCEFVGGMCITACFCAFLSLTTITINKYLYVCQNRFYQKFCKRYICILICISCWLLSLLFEFPNIVGWGGHYFDKKSHQCIWQRTASWSYTLLVSVGFIGCPLVTMGVCFILIFLKIWKTKKDVFKLNHDDPLRMRRVWLETMRTSRTLLVVFFAFVTCWTPYAVVNIVDFDDKLPLEVHLFLTMLAHSHSSLNFTIYMIFSASFRQNVKQMFSCLFVPDWKIKNSLESSSRATSELPRSETDSDKPRKFYLPTTFRPTLGGDPKVKVDEFTAISEEKTNGVVDEGESHHNGLEKY